jgi:hypothetical protein
MKNMLKSSTAPRSVRFACVTEAKQRSQWSVIGWVSKIYYLQLLRASEATLSRWSRLHLQSLASTPILRRVDVKRRPDVKIIAESLSQHDEKSCGIDLTQWVKGRKKKRCKTCCTNSTKWDKHMRMIMWHSSLGFCLATSFTPKHHYL